MKSIKPVVLFSLLIQSATLFSQSADRVEMADVLRQDGKIYSVVAGIVIILTAMIVLLIRLDRRIFRMEQQKRGLENK